MTEFVWTTIVLIALTTLGKLLMLWHWEPRAPTRGVFILDIICNLVLLGWGLWVVKGAT